MRPSNSGLAAVAIALSVGLSFSGCAWVEPPPSQSIAVRMLQADGNEIEQAQCRASNDRGSWLFEAPGRVLLPRSPAPLDVTCQSGRQTGAVRVLAKDGVWHVSRVATVGGLHEMMDPWRYRPVDYPTSIDVIAGERRGYFEGLPAPVPMMGR